MLNENFVLLGAFINLLGVISYVKDTLAGKVKPNRATWGLWALAAFIAFSAEIKQGVGIQALCTFMFAFNPFLIFLASFVNKKAYWALGKLDLYCGTLSVIGLILWYITKNGNIAILFAIFADLTAGIPTLIKSYHFPETENWKEFLSSLINVVVTMFTLKIWSFAYLAFPLYIFLYTFIAIILIRFKVGKKIGKMK